MPNDADRQAAKALAPYLVLDMTEGELAALFARHRHAAYQQGQRDMQERAAEWFSDRFSEAVQADCEHGVRSLNERAAAIYLKDAPDTLAAICEAPDAIRALPIKETPDGTD